MQGCATGACGGDVCLLNLLGDAGLSGFWLQIAGVSGKLLLVASLLVC